MIFFAFRPHIYSSRCIDKPTSHSDLLFEFIVIGFASSHDPGPSLCPAPAPCVCDRASLRTGFTTSITSDIGCLRAITFKPSYRRFRQRAQWIQRKSFDSLAMLHHAKILSTWAISNLWSSTNRKCNNRHSENRCSSPKKPRMETVRATVLLTL